jgi:hypothetical protein
LELTYDRAKELNLPVEEMTKPLFAWIFSYLETHTSPELRIETKQNWGYKMVKTWIFLLFFHQVIEGKYSGSLGAYIGEKKNTFKPTVNNIAATTMTMPMKAREFFNSNNL